MIFFKCEIYLVRYCTFCVHVFRPVLLVGVTRSRLLSELCRSLGILMLSRLISSWNLMSRLISSLDSLCWLVEFVALMLLCCALAVICLHLIIGYQLIAVRELPRFTHSTICTPNYFSQHTDVIVSLVAEGSNIDIYIYMRLLQLCSRER